MRSTLNSLVNYKRQREQCENEDNKKLDSLLKTVSIPNKGEYENENENETIKSKSFSIRNNYSAYIEKEANENNEEKKIEEKDFSTINNFG